MDSYKKPPKFIWVCLVAMLGSLVLVKASILTPWSTLAFLLSMAVLAIWLVVEIFRSVYIYPVDEHVENLRKGGLIPRVEKSIHERALRRIGRETPNVQLPKRQYFNK